MLPRDCFQSTEEPKLAHDKGAAFPAAEPRGPDQLLLLVDRGCLGCHLLQSQVSSSAGTWSEEEKTQVRDGVEGLLDSELQHRFHSPGAATGGWQQKVCPSLLSSLGLHPAIQTSR